MGNDYFNAYRYSYYHHDNINSPVNFDNAATTFPKPESVKNIVLKAMDKCGGNVGRGGHSLAMVTSEMVYESRQTIADFFEADTENVVFTFNCTHALNYAIKGIMNGGGHIIISSLEHNAVSRPVYALSKTGKVRYSVAKVYEDDAKTIQSFKELINSETKAIACTIASNVTGQILPYKEIAKLCQEKNICFIADGAQACGVLPITLSDGINILCTAGHKGLFGTTGTGLLISDGKYKIRPILMQGGTGSASLDPNQPDYLPDSLESGTINIVGAASLKAGIEFIRKKTLKRIYAHENKLCEKFIAGLSNNDDIIIYRNGKSNYVPIVSFNIKGMMPEEVARMLNEKGFCMRSGFHCAGLAHQSLGNENGTVRFAPSVFNTEIEVMRAIQTIKKINKNHKSY